jgi:hypothetical protein
VLRSGRERRRITLSRLSRETKVREEIWEALEENDLSRWPNGIYARSLIRQYAERVDLDAEGLVNEFCRHFANGDRRRQTIIREVAELIAHRGELDDPEGPSGVRRRFGDVPAESSPWIDVLKNRAVPAAIAATDLGAVVLLGRLASLVFATSFWPTTAVVALGYHVTVTLTGRRTLGARLVDWARTRVRFSSLERAVGTWNVPDRYIRD